MTLQEALKEAIESLGFEADETYTEEEIEDDEDCRAFVERKNEAANILDEYLKTL